MYICSSDKQLSVINFDKEFDPGLVFSAIEIQ